MSLASGKYAYVEGIPCVQAWERTKSASVSMYEASCVPGGSATTAGNISEAGSMSGIGYLPPMPSEEPFEFIGVASAKPGAYLNWLGDVFVTETVITMPVKAGTVITWQDTFVVDGVLTKDTSQGYEDATREPGPSAKFCKIAIEGTPDSNTFTDLTNVQSITLTFRRPAVDSVNAGVTNRDTGNLQCELSFQIDNDDTEIALYELNSIKRVRVYVTSTLFYLLDAIQWADHTNYRVQRSPQQMIGYTVNGKWTAIRPQTPPALGEILLPGGGLLYGEDES